jgi:hypothetical protein
VLVFRKYFVEVYRIVAGIFIKEKKEGLQIVYDVKVYRKKLLWFLFFSHKVGHGCD